MGLRRQRLGWRGSQESWQLIREDCLARQSRDGEEDQAQGE